MGVSAEFVVGVIGNISGVCLFACPVMTFYGILKKKTTDSFSSTPYLCALLNCALWLLYGMPFITENGILLMTINGIGALLELSFLSIYMRYAPRAAKVRTAQVGGAFGLFYVLVILVISVAFHRMQSRHATVGILCVLITIVMYAAPLSIMRLVIKTKSVEYMPLALSCMVLMNSASWSTFAVLKHDVYIMIPNFIGVVLGVGQLVMYACYYKRDTAKAKASPVEEDLEMHNHKPSYQNGNAAEVAPLTSQQNGAKVFASQMDTVKSASDASLLEPKTFSPDLSTPDVKT